MDGEQAARAGPSRPPFELFGLSWLAREFVSYGEWAGWGDLPTATARIEALRGMFVDPPWDAFEAQTDVRAFDAALIQLWAAVRMPPAEGER